MDFCSSSKAVHGEKWKKAKRDNRKCFCLKTGKKGWKYQNRFYRSKSLGGVYLRIIEVSKGVN